MSRADPSSPVGPPPFVIRHLSSVIRHPRLKGFRTPQEKDPVTPPIGRREMLRGAACGFGYLALAGLASDRRAEAASRDPLAPRRPHFAPRAKRVIFLFMQGGVSQVDSFDYKPRLEESDGKTLAFDDA